MVGAAETRGSVVNMTDKSKGKEYGYASRHHRKEHVPDVVM